MVRFFAKANSNGGTIYIGKDDNGKVVGVADYKKLMEDLPNKIRDILGIMVEVNLHEETSLHYIEIVTPPYAAWKRKHHRIPKNTINVRLTLTNHKR